MALKDSLRSRRAKRTYDVLKRENSKSDEVNFSSSDSESGISTVGKNKVRGGVSTKRLMKQSECFKVDGDHIYTSVESHMTLYDSGRKRKLLEGIDEKPVKKRCVSKSAVMARLNRERKKRYISSLETENKSLQERNTEMTEKIEKQIKTIFAMRREILYLKGLLANSAELAQILKNINETTGLPVTSSMVLATENKSRQIVKTLEKSHCTDGGDKSLEEYQPRIRSVNSGCNFPILDKDINLGSSLGKSLDDMADLEHYPFDFENDTYDLSPPPLNDDDTLFNFNSQNFHLEQEEPVQLQDFSKNRDPNVGICLHVNQKRVSVEICSICNTRAGSLLREF